MAPARLDAEAQWSEAVSQLGLFPIYPPSEDVMVGDVFLHLPNAQYLDLVRITAAPRGPLARQLCFQEQDRLVSDSLVRNDKGDLQTTAGASGTVNADRNCSELRRQHRVASHMQPTTATHVTRLREAAMPTLEVGRFSEGEIAGAGLLGNIGASLGIGWSSGAATRVELRHLQTLTLEELRGSRLVEDVAIERVQEAQSRARQRDAAARSGRRALGAPGRSGRSHNALTPLMLARSLSLNDLRNGGTAGRDFCGARFDRLESAGVRIIVANRILYASGVTFNFLTEDVAVVRLGLEFASALANMPQAPTVVGLPTAPTVTPPARGSNDAPRPAEPPRSAATFPGDFDAQRALMLSNINRVMGMSASTPGQAQARLVAGRFGTLGLERDFTRPAAVGMGAALHFTIAEAALPADEDEVEDAVQFCTASYGAPPAGFREQLRSNLRWVEYLERRDSGMTAEQARQGLAAPVNSSTQRRQELPSFGPPRVRL